MAIAGAVPGTAVKRVLVVDRQRAFAESLEVVMAAQGDLAPVGSAATAADAIAMVVAHRPDVVILDVALPEVDGIDVIKRIVEHDPGVAVVVLTGGADASLLARAASAGAAAFLLKDASVSQIVDAVRTVGHAPSMTVDSTTIGRVLDEAPEPAAAFTQRELEVLGLLALGQQPKQIAHALGITVNTCRGYVKNILAKLDAHSALEAVLEANRLGLVALPGGDRGGRQPSAIACARP